MPEDYRSSRTHPSTDLDLADMTPQVATEDLIDAQVVAEILGLSHRNSVSPYQRRYADMPRPVLDLGDGRVKLWLRPDIEKWAQQQAAAGRSRRRSRSST